MAIYRTRFVCIEEACYTFSGGDFHNMNRGKRRNGFRGIPNLMIKAHAYAAYATKRCRTVFLLQCLFPNKKKRLFHAVGRHLQVVDQLGVLQ